MSEKLYVLGSDEVGYGAISGALLIGAVRAPNDWSIPGLNDSKKLSDKQRRTMNEKLLKLADAGEIQIAYAERTNQQIDLNGVYPMLKECYKEVAVKLYQDDTLIIIDGNVDFSVVLAGFDYKTMVKADTIVPHCMAGSIIAKVKRDDQMIKLAPDFPDYNWATNKGYYDAAHIDAIKKYGRTIHHRKSYKLKALGEKKDDDIKWV